MKTNRRFLVGCGVAAAAAASACAPSAARADTQAYWKFDDLPPGTEFVPPPTNGGPGSGLALDSSGHNNNLRTFADFTNPVYGAPLTATVPQTGLPNTASLNFTPNEDLYSEGASLNAFDFNQFTVEAAFRTNSLTRYGGIVGKDGKPTASLIAPLQMKVRDDSDALQIEILDGAGVEKQVQSVPLVAGRTYFAAAVNDGANLSLYLFDTANPGAGYALQGTVPLSDAGGDGLFDSDANFSVGRGFFNNNVTDWIDGTIDEVRISDTALAPGQFLFAQVPEPSALLGATASAGFGVLGRRRRS
jgi:hypothetical protein